MDKDEIRDMFLGNMTFYDQMGLYTTRYEEANYLRITKIMFEEIIKELNDDITR